MIRAFVKVGPPFRRTEEITAALKGTGPPALISEVAQQEFKLYIWPTTTMRTVCAQIHAAAPIASPFARHSIRVVFYDSRLGAYRARDYLHGITRVSQTGLIQLLGDDDHARDIASIAMPSNQRNRGRTLAGEADGKAGEDTATGEEEGVINSARTIESLGLRDGDCLDVVIHASGIRGVPYSGPATGLNQRAPIRESLYSQNQNTSARGGWDRRGRDLESVSMSATRGARGVGLGGPSYQERPRVTSGGWGRTDASMERPRGGWGDDSRDSKYERSVPPPRGVESARRLSGSEDRWGESTRRNNDREDTRMAERKGDDQGKIRYIPPSSSHSGSRSPSPWRRSVSRSPSRRRSRSRSRGGWSP